MSTAMLPNDPHPDSDADHSVGNASPCTTSKFTSQSKEERLFIIDNFLKIVVN